MSDVTRRMAMSEAQVKATPSKAAMELVRVILYPFHVLVTEEQYRDAAAVVDEQLADLLEKAQAVSDHAPGENQLRNVVRYVAPNNRAEIIPRTLEAQINHFSFA